MYERSKWKQDWLININRLSSQIDAVSFFDKSRYRLCWENEMHMSDIFLLIVVHDQRSNVIKALKHSYRNESYGRYF